MFQNIISVVIGLIFYNMFLKSIGMIVIERILNTETGKEKIKEIKEKLKNKINE